MNPTETAPIAFIIAAPRSGTTWTQKALNSHPEILAVEQRLFGGYRDIWRDAADGRSSLRITLDAYIDTFLRTYGHPALLSGAKQAEDRLMQVMLQSIVSFGLNQSGKSLLVDKITPYEGTSDVVQQQLERFFPTAKKVFLLRDPRDVVLSNVMLWLGRNPDSTPIQQRRDGIFLNQMNGSYQRFFCDSDLNRFCDQWMDAIRYLMPICGLTIRYEDLLKDQAASLAKLFRYLSVESSSSVIAECCEESSFNKMSGGRMRGDGRVTDFIRKGIAGDWKNYLTRDDGIAINSRIGEILLEYDYATDPDWFQELPSERIVCH